MCKYYDFDKEVMFSGSQWHFLAESQKMAGSFLAANSATKRRSFGSYSTVKFKIGNLETSW